MITIERVHCKQSIDSKFSKFEGNKNVSNGTQTSLLETVSSEETRTTALEKTITFIQLQQESMLEGLHMEIENLRRENKSLQFRLIMCTCCSAKNRNISPEDLCQNRVMQLESEVKNIRSMLVKEKQSNTSLLKEVQELRCLNSKLEQNQRDITIKFPNQTEPEATSVKEFAEEKSDQVTQPIQESSEYSQRFPSEADRSEVSHSQRLLKPERMTGLGISSPSLVDESASTVVVLEPRDPQTDPEGLWARRSVRHLVRDENSHASTKSGCFSGSRIMPMRLPGLKVEKPIRYASSSKLDKHYLSPNILTDKRTCLTDLKSVASFRKKSISGKSDSMYVGSNVPDQQNLAIVGDTHKTPVQRNARAASQNYLNQIGSFLPSLAKSGDANLVTKPRKSKPFQRKRSDGSNNFYPP